MKRTIYKKLVEWKEGKLRKPLVLKGARQTGKTYILQVLGTEFRKLHYINFQKDKNALKIFETDLTPKNLINSIEFYLDTSINIEQDLVFFDEIQDSPRALTSLKYFCEEMPELAIVCAGSLLGVTQSDEPFPVGKISFLHLYPMSFEEFLLAVNDEKSVTVINSIGSLETIPEVAHHHLMKRTREYFITGGLPEVVKIYSLHRDNKFEALKKVREKQADLITAYISDFSKYSGKVRANEITAVFESIPAQLSKENKKFKASMALPGGRFSRLKSPVDWLTNAGLLIKVKISNSGEIPFSAFTSENRFKTYCFDIGILGALAGIPPKTIVLEDDLFATFKGAFCENYVAQEFICSGAGQLYSWASNTSEVEFIREIDGDVYPVEVKAGKSGKLKSLNVFAGKYKTARRIRISGRNLEFNDDALMNSYPMYLAYSFPRRIGS